jgi:hypothetical protein
MEKKYISVPMKMAREIMMEQKEKENEKLTDKVIHYN